MSELVAVGQFVVRAVWDYLVIALGGAIVLGYATNVVLRSGGA